VQPIPIDAYARDLSIAQHCAIIAYVVIERGGINLQMGVVYSLRLYRASAQAIGRAGRCKGFERVENRGRFLLVQITLSATYCSSSCAQLKFKCGHMWPVGRSIQVQSRFSLQAANGSRAATWRRNDSVNCSRCQQRRGKVTVT